MELILNKGLNLKSAVLKHRIAIEAVKLLYGREESLKTELDIYIILAFMDTLCENNLIEECNNDTRDLMTIIEQDIEPEFLKLMENDDYKAIYEEVREDVQEYCVHIYEQNHSILGLFNTIIDAIASLQPEQVQEVLVKTGEIAGNLEEKKIKAKTEIENKKIESIEETNDKLQALIDKFTKEQAEINK